jgi:hypothetical protein
LKGFGWNRNASYFSFNLDGTWLEIDQSEDRTLRTNYTTDVVRDRPFNLQGGGYVFLFRSEFFFRTTRELEYFFFPQFNIRLYDKNSTKIRIFCSSTLRIRIRVYVGKSIVPNISHHFVSVVCATCGRYTYVALFCVRRLSNWFKIYYISLNYDLVFNRNIILSSNFCDIRTDHL